IGIAERSASASVPISLSCGCTHPIGFSIALSSLQTSFEIITEHLRGDLGERNQRRLPDDAFAAQLRVDEAKGVQLSDVLPELRVGSRLLIELLAYNRVRVFRIPHRDVRFLAAFPRDCQEDQLLRHVEEAETLLDIRRMDMGLRAAHMLRRDLVRSLLVCEHSGFLEQLNRVAGVPEFGSEVPDHADEAV